jgi:AcrR family transcriptional regulator
MGRAFTDRTRQRARDAFLAELALRGNISDAARAAGVSRRTVYEWREADASFAADWNEALETAIDAMEREAYRRAFEGTRKPVIGRVGKDEDGILSDENGEPLYLREYSDSLATLLLKAHRPEKYRERQEVQHTGRVGIEYVNDWRRAED